MGGGAGALARPASSSGEATPCAVVVDECPSVRLTESAAGVLSASRPAIGRRSAACCFSPSSPVPCAPTTAVGNAKRDKGLHAVNCTSANRGCGAASRSGFHVTIFARNGVPRAGVVGASSIVDTACSGCGISKV